jgi:hypothetical protein
MVDLLLQRGAKVNRTSNDGNTALMYAVVVGDEEITDLLLQCNADIMMKNWAGWTVFHCAAFLQRKTILNQLLVSHGTHWQLTVDVEDNYGRTPLYIAAKHGCLDCVDVLLVHGANPEHKSHSDESPLDIAKKNGHTRIVSMMTEALTIRTHRYACDMNTISMLKQNNDQLNKENKELKEKLSEADQESERLKSMIEQKDEELMELSCQRTSMRKDVEEEQAFEALKRSVMTHGADQWYSLGIQLGYNCFQLVATTQMVSMPEEKLHIVMSRKHAEVGTKKVTDLLLKACKFIPYPIYEAVVSDVGPHPV